MPMMVNYFHRLLHIPTTMNHFADQWNPQRSVFHRLTDVTLPLAPEDERTQVLQELTDETKMRLYHPHSHCPHLFSLFPLLFRKYNI